MTGVDLAGNNVSRTTTTNNQGGYSFENLVAGVYTIQETQPGGGFLDGGERAGTGGGTVTNDTITVALGAASINNDFCELVPARIAVARMSIAITTACLTRVNCPLLEFR